MTIITIPHLNPLLQSLIW